jgi:hypothetical protein
MCTSRCRGVIGRAKELGPRFFVVPFPAQFELHLIGEIPKRKSPGEYIQYIKEESV